MPKKSHKSLKDQAKKLWPQNVKLAEDLARRMKAYPKIDFATETHKYSKELEALIRPKTKPFQRDIYHIPKLEDLWESNDRRQSSLNERENRVIFLKDVCRLTYKEIAIKMKEPASRLQKLYSRTKKKCEKTGEGYKPVTPRYKLRKRVDSLIPQ